MKKSFYIIAIISILVSCTSSTSGPKTKNDYIKSATSFYNDVESQKESMNDEKWSEFKDKNDKIIGLHLWRMPSSSRAYPLPIERKALHYLKMLQIEGIQSLNN
ncbi:MAG: hypothetical protein IKL56_06390 [Bacteroidaceae bacterium]|nr:hypothetical protein [Bacteroidaceae bacterium]